MIKNITKLKIKIKHAQKFKSKQKIESYDVKSIKRYIFDAYIKIDINPF